MGLQLQAKAVRALEFQSTHPVWGGTAGCSCALPQALISIHPPRMGWDLTPPEQYDIWNAVSIHPPRMGWDHGARHLSGHHLHFNPPTPYGVGHVAHGFKSFPRRFQSTHPVWGGTTVSVGFLLDSQISIHPPRMGWDIVARILSIQRLLFQSTHPVWGGTDSLLGDSTRKVFQSTHPVWGGTYP